MLAVVIFLSSDYRHTYLCKSENYLFELLSMNYTTIWEYGDVCLTKVQGVPKKAKRDSTEDRNRTSDIKNKAM